MTVAAKDAESGRYYRLPRDPGQSYYLICALSKVKRLEKRLLGQDPRALPAEARKTLQAIGLCRNHGHVLGIRVVRYRNDQGAPHETRAYVAFPLDYHLREVARPPGYGTPRLKGVG